MAKQNATAAISIQSFTCAQTFSSRPETPVVNTKDEGYCYSDIKVWRFKEQFASCIFFVLHFSETKTVQQPNERGEDTIFTSIAHEGKHESLQTVQHISSTKKVPCSNLHLQKFPLRLDKRVTLLSRPKRRRK